MHVIMQRFYDRGGRRVWAGTDKNITSAGVKVPFVCSTSTDQNCTCVKKNSVVHRSARMSPQFMGSARVAKLGICMCEIREGGSGPRNCGLGAIAANRDLIFLVKKKRRYTIRDSREDIGHAPHKRENSRATGTTSADSLKTPWKTRWTQNDLSFFYYNPFFIV
ncbi:hypothetical protein BGW80DRAFT_1362371 [Lactifluus volemus]|nr:hypothetical protein BGW80DRAFT_1362371 [Lactifluus volemus]